MWPLLQSEPITSAFQRVKLNPTGPRRITLTNHRAECGVPVSCMQKPFSRLFFYGILLLTIIIIRTRRSHRLRTIRDASVSLRTWSPYALGRHGLRGLNKIKQTCVCGPFYHCGDLYQAWKNLNKSLFETTMVWFIFTSMRHSTSMS